MGKLCKLTLRRVKMAGKKYGASHTHLDKKRNLRELKYSLGDFEKNKISLDFIEVWSTERIRDA